MTTITIDRAVVELALEVLNVMPNSLHQTAANEWWHSRWLAESALHKALNAPEPEPVAFYNFQTHKLRWAKPTVYAEIVAVDVPELPLYAVSPRREWEPLSLDQISMAWDRAYRQPLSQSALNFARDLENTLKGCNT